MSFTSYRFPVFTATVLAVYYTVPRKWQWMTLLAAGWGFYLLCDGENLPLLLVTTLLTYAVSRRMAANQRSADPKTARRKNRLWLGGYVCLLVAGLGFFKVRLATLGIALPMGISFYLFQSVGYALDVHRRGIPAENNLGKLALFLSYFPQLTQGPISRYGSLAGELLAPHFWDAQRVRSGARRMLWGYFKKLVIADRIAVAVAALNTPEHTGTAFLTLTVCYAIQIYGDFTGGMDIALGLSEALGIRLAENFTRPFFSRSVAEYWRRWHITLGSWMKDYIFYPISVSAPIRAMSRRTRKRWPKLGKRLPVYAASLVTWLCTGLWHGITPNFLTWGLMNCAVIVLSQELTPLYEKFHRRFGLKQRRWYGVWEMLRTFALMNLIRAADLYPRVGEYFRQLGHILTPTRLTLRDMGLTGLDAAILLVGCGLMLMVSLFQEKRGSVRETMARHEGVGFALTLALLLAVLLLGHYGVGYDPVNFIYNQF